MYFAASRFMKTDLKYPGVLLLEKDNDLADSIRAFLEDSYRVFVTENPDELPVFISQYHIHVVITDVDALHPKLDKILKEIKSSDPQVKIILMYLFIDEDEISEKSIFLDADDIILKPFDVDVLRHKLDKLYKASQFSSFSKDLH
jgi:DNA-binding NtrC family response regulator